MKNSIQFKHFRKFENFPKLDFNDITFVVGKNNSGKSTFVKAFVMVYNYLKSGNLKQLDLNQESVELLNIVTFDRALCKTMSERESKEYIPITLKLGNYEFYLNVTGKKDSTILDVITFKIIDTASHFTIKIEPQKNHAIVSYSHKEIIQNDALKEALQQKQKLEQILTSIKDELSKESIDLKNSIEKLSKIIDNLKDAKTETETSFTIEEFYSASNFTELFDELYISFETRYWIENHNVELFNQTDSDSLLEEDTIEDSEEKDISENEVFSDLRYYYINRQEFEKFFEDFIIFIESSKIFYLPATLNKQSALLSIRDKNNDLAEVVHKYYQLGLQNNTIISGFVKHWINEFQIGTDIQIELVNGEAYDVTLTENGVPIPLADKGMGSIQSVLLILRLASVIYFKEQVKKATKFDYFIIVEEPELNLHPALQSKLCDLFFEVYEKYDVKFIIETHSEYIIRRSQVMNARKEFSFDDDTINPTPFATLYFNSDSEKTAYSMNYQPDGTFENSFGNGFFDASSSSTLELIRLKRQKIQ
ncbi:AAA family ATPase [Elizabethkingia anophelis]|nr:AAA family ATPase [Elizabethkingia anophelis]